MFGMQYTAEYTNTLFSRGVAINDHMGRNTKTVPVLVICKEDTKAHLYSCISVTAKRNRLVSTNVGTSEATNESQTLEIIWSGGLTKWKLIACKRSATKECQVDGAQPHHADGNSEMMCPREECSCGDIFLVGRALHNKSNYAKLDIQENCLYFGGGIRYDGRVHYEQDDLTTQVRSSETSDAGGGVTSCQRECAYLVNCEEINTSTSIEITADSSDLSCLKDIVNLRDHECQFVSPECEDAVNVQKDSSKATVVNLRAVSSVVVGRKVFDPGGFYSFMC